jgi:hypothetical protein
VTGRTRRPAGSAVKDRWDALDRKLRARLIAEVFPRFVTDGLAASPPRETSEAMLARFEGALHRLLDQLEVLRQADERLLGQSTEGPLVSSYIALLKKDPDARPQVDAEKVAGTLAHFGVAARR